MGKKSVRENKNIYQQYREALELTREKASEQMAYVSPDRIEKIESGKSAPHPDEILAMAACYQAPTLCNYYCTHECPIGQEHVQEIQEKNLSQIVLEVITSVNALNRAKDRFVEIAVNGRVDDDQYQDFAAIREQLRQISQSVSSLQLWVEKEISEGKLDRDHLNAGKNIN